MDFKLETVIGPDLLKSLLPGLVEKCIEPSSQDEEVKYEQWCGPCKMYCMDSKALERHRKAHERTSNSGTLVQDLIDKIVMHELAKKSDSDIMMHGLDKKTEPLVEEIIFDIDIDNIVIDNEQKPNVDEIIIIDKKPDVTVIVDRDHVSEIIDRDRKPDVSEIIDIDKKTDVVVEIIDVDQKPDAGEIIDIDEEPVVDKVTDIYENPVADKIIGIDQNAVVDKLTESDPLLPASEETCPSSYKYPDSYHTNNHIVDIDEPEHTQNPDQINKMSKFNLNNAHKFVNKSKSDCKKLKFTPHINEPRLKTGSGQKIPKHNAKNHFNKPKTVAAKHSFQKVLNCSKKATINIKVVSENGAKVTVVKRRPRRITNDFFLCDACSKGFFIKENLIKHLNNCPGTPESDLKVSRAPLSDRLTRPNDLTLIKCDICLRTFSNYVQLSLHKRLHRGDRMYCDICKIRSRNILYHYMRWHRSRLLCDVCGETVTTRNQLQYHKRKHVGYYGTFVCDHCKKHMKRKCHLVVHLNHRQKYGLCPGLTRYVCDSCKRPMTTREGIIAHLKRNHKIFPCYFCNRSFTNKYVWQYHMVMHKDDRLATCHFCNISYAFKKQLREHKERVHRNLKALCEKCGYFVSAIRFRTHHAVSHSRKFCCNVCKKMFQWKSNFKRHLKIHAGIAGEDKNNDSVKSMPTSSVRTKFYCDYCGIKFVFQNSIVKHLQLHHTDTTEKPFTCKICNKLFQSKTSCLEHKLLHTGEKEFGCDMCEKSFCTKQNLTAHRRVHSGELFACTFCPKKFQIMFFLKAHIEKHLTMKNVSKEVVYSKKFNCDVCGKRFATKSAVVAHKCIKTEDELIFCDSCKNRFRNVTDLAFHRCPGIKIKAIVCRICNKHFSKKSNLRSHSKREHDLDVFTCDHCNMLFSSEGLLTAHQRR